MNDDLPPILCLSFDFELAIGWQLLSDEKFKQKEREMQDSKKRIRELINKLEQYNIPCTWNTVTHLFLDACDTHSDFPGTIPRDPESNIEDNSNWYAPELINNLLQSDCRFEIGGHSFSHALFSNISSDIAEYELRKSQELADKMGLELTAFSFPQNKENHLDLLSKYGYKIYRSHSKSTPIEKGIRATRILSGHDFPRPHSPRMNDFGLIELKPSLSLERYLYSNKEKWLSQTPFHRGFSEYLRVGLERTIQTGGVFHVHGHPASYQYTIPTHRIDKFLNIVDEYRSEYGLQILTMSEIYEELQHES